MHRVALVLMLASCGKGGDGDELIPCESCDEIGASTRFARLTHVQYEHTVRDLLQLGEGSELSSSFIGDVLSEGGFDNDGNRLEVGNDLWLDYQRAAETLAASTVLDTDRYAAVVPEDPRPSVRGVDFDVLLEGEGDQVTASVGTATRNGWLLWSAGQVSADIELPKAADYRITTRVWADQAGPDLARMRIDVDGTTQVEQDISAVDFGSGEEVSVELPLTAGGHTVAVWFLNDYYSDPDDRNLYVDWIAVEGAAPEYTGTPPGEDEAAAWIRRFGAKVHRRPLSDEQVEAYAALHRVGATLSYTDDPFQDGIYTVMSAMLQSPHLLYRSEHSTTQDAQGRIVLDDWDLASKLSYALTNTMPDDELWQVATEGRLVETEVFAAQVDRLLATPGAVEAIDHFHGQLLELDAYDNIYKDPDMFPDWNPALNDAMRQEALLFTRSVVLEDQSVYDLFTAPRTYVNRDLAPLYGLAVDSETLVPVDLDAAERAGVLTLSGFLASQAHSNEIDSIHRGAFLNLRLLCSRLPPPPNVVPPLPEPVPGQSNRERVHAHTGPGTCGAGCHAETINPVGFAFENYDAVGRWRTEDADKPVDATGSFEFSGQVQSWTTPVEFAELVGGSSNAHGCLTRNWMRYLHGRNTSTQDLVLVDRLAAQSRTQDLAIRQVIRELVTADAFKHRNPEVVR